MEGGEVSEMARRAKAVGMSEIAGLLAVGYFRGSISLDVFKPQD
jgi:hypothetical protein